MVAVPAVIVAAGDVVLCRDRFGGMDLKRFQHA
jgi:hypothetical protein